jgi:Ca2+-transporting ATPase
VLAPVLVVYAWVLSRGLGAEEARMMSFATLVIGNLGLIFTNRSWTRTILATLRIPNPALWWITGGTLLVLGLTVMVPFLQKIFSFAPMHLGELAVVAAAGLFAVLFAESVKLRWFRKGR